MTPSASVRFRSVLPTFVVDDVRATAEQHRDLYGFRIAFVLGGGSGEFAIVDLAEGQGFHLKRGDPAKARRNARIQTGAKDAYVRYGGVDALHARVKQAGGKIVSGIDERPWGMRELRVEDRNGLVIVFGEDASGRSPRDERRTAPTFLVSDLRASASFYEKTLGFAPGLWADPPIYGVHARDGVEVHHTPAPAGVALPRNAGGARVWDAFVEVDGIEAVRDELRAKGGNFRRDLETTDYEMREIEIVDADGYALCFGEPVGGW
ncbi:MAG TPA: VOC family protein [Planctomycetota bacterium]|nr:VOC family protein [Planctomycetota bacterium]